MIACSLKFFQGGWFPLVLGLAIFTVMASWRRGRELLLESIGQDDPELLPFVQALAADGVNRARTHGGLRGGQSRTPCRRR